MDPVQPAPPQPKSTPAESGSHIHWAQDVDPSPTLFMTATKTSQLVFELESQTIRQPTKAPPEKTPPPVLGRHAGLIQARLGALTKAPGAPEIPDAPPPANPKQAAVQEKPQDIQPKLPQAEGAIVDIADKISTLTKDIIDTT